MPQYTTLTELEQTIIICRACPRLVEWREKIGEVKRKAYREETYWARPVPGFGDINAKVLVVGLAPGAHGSNRTGRMFTGDDSGNFLYPALFKAGFASQPTAVAVDDGLTLNELFITAVSRCVPPDNKPTNTEISACLPYLESELNLLENLLGIVALGRIAYDVMVRLLYPPGYGLVAPRFAHGALMVKSRQKPWIIASYHPSRQNTQTGRLTAPMFDEIWDTVTRLL